MVGPGTQPGATRAAPAVRDTIDEVAFFTGDTHAPLPLAELRRRFMTLPESVVPRALTHILTLPVAPPAEYRVQDMRHKPGLVEL